MANKGGSDWTSDLNPFGGCNTGCTIFVLVITFLIGMVVAIAFKV